MKINALPVANRLDYSVLVLTIPPLSPAKRKNAAVIQLSSLYPVSLEEKSIRLFKNGKKKNSWICIISPKSDEKQSLRSSTLYVINRCKHFSGRAAFISDNFAEIFDFENGTLISCNAISEKSGEKITQAFLEKECVFTKSDILGGNDKKEILRKLFIAGLAVIVFITFSLNVISSYKKRLDEEARERNRIELENENKIKKQRQTAEKLSSLKQEYEEKLRTSSVNIYESFSVLYSCVGKSAKVESMSVEGSSFQTDIHSSDGAEVLSKFEQNQAVKSVRMSRSAREQGREFVTYSGTLRRHALVIDEKISDEEKILIYENALKKLAEKQDSSDENLSAYIQRLRSAIKESSCTEEYLQVSEANKRIQIECMMKGSASSAFSLLKSTSDEFDFRSVRIRSSSNGSLVRMVAKLDSHIEGTKVGNSFILGNAGVEEPNLSDLNRSFYKPPAFSTSQVAKKNSGTAVTKVQSVQPQPKIAKKTSNLEYVGAGGSAKSGRYIFFKDKSTGDLYKLPILESGNGDFCREISFSSYEVHFKGEIYEVRK
ncbi:MAG: hypothetical protein IJ530_09200 [Treponema sp.]|uniref:hypothetical protein n=1 Tax=Treponema sp. TaxID=166 RepID=UPI0025F444C9|nr:hypothetical protein [Treponema sp.]MBQ8679931.1 hypothetical protein [Treponema sp.]